MKKHRLFLDIANFLLSLVILLFLTVAGLYAGYGLWDNRSINLAADEVRNDMVKLRPEILEDEGPSFDEIRAINSDVVGWISLDDTSIDYPVVQGESNLSYINTDVYGKFALAGSIFLDSSGSTGFEDFYNLLYGHSITQGRMFSDINKFKEESYYKSHGRGSLLVPGSIYDLEIFALVLVPSNEKEIFEPLYWQETQETQKVFLDYVRENAIFFQEEVLEKIQGEPALKVLALTTCSDEFTDARTGILALMHSR